VGDALGSFAGVASEIRIHSAGTPAFFEGTSRGQCYRLGRIVQGVLEQLR
jgi:hypothetical protein